MTRAMNRREGPTPILSAPTTLNGNNKIGTREGLTGKCSSASTVYVDRDAAREGGCELEAKEDVGNYQKVVAWRQKTTKPPSTRQPTEYNRARYIEKAPEKKPFPPRFLTYQQASKLRVGTIVALPRYDVRKTNIDMDGRLSEKGPWGHPVVILESKWPESNIFFIGICHSFGKFGAETTAIKQNDPELATINFLIDDGFFRCSDNPRGLHSRCATSRPSIFNVRTWVKLEPLEIDYQGLVTIRWPDNKLEQLAEDVVCGMMKRLLAYHLEHKSPTRDQITVRTIFDDWELKRRRSRSQGELSASSVTYLSTSDSSIESPLPSETENSPSSDSVDQDSIPPDHSTSVPPRTSSISLKTNVPELPSDKYVPPFKNPNAQPLSKKDVPLKKGKGRGRQNERCSTSDNFSPNINMTFNPISTITNHFHVTPMGGIGKKKERVQENIVSEGIGFSISKNPSPEVSIDYGGPLKKSLDSVQRTPLKI